MWEKLCEQDFTGASATFHIFHVIQGAVLFSVRKTKGAVHEHTPAELPLRQAGGDQTSNSLTYQDIKGWEKTQSGRKGWENFGRLVGMATVLFTVGHYA